MERVDMMVEPLRALLLQIGAFVPRLLLALAVLVIAIDYLDIGGAIVRQSFLILSAGLVLALALAFGLGGRAWAAAQLERWWPSGATPPASDRDRLP